MSKLDLSHHLLISTPGLRGSGFAESLVYLCSHDSGGAFGLIVNKPSETTVGKLLRSLKVCPHPSFAKTADIVANGGPVRTEQVFILHGPPFRYEFTLKSDDDELGVTMSQDILLAINEGRAPEKMLFAFGCAGWSGGQLETEIAQNAWIAAPAAGADIFNFDFDGRLFAAARKIGFDWNRLSQNAGRA